MKHLMAYFDKHIGMAFWIWFHMYIFRKKLDVNMFMKYFDIDIWKRCLDLNIWV